MEIFYVKYFYMVFFFLHAKCLKKGNLRAFFVFHVKNFQVKNVTWKRNEEGEASEIFLCENFLL